MPTIEKSIDVDRPLRSVYRQWVRFEDFPCFMSEVVDVRRVAAGYLHWRVAIGGSEYELDVEITEQIPHRRVSWVSRGEQGCAGKVKLHALPGDGTRVMLQLAYPRDRLPRDADALQIVRALVQGDLERFKRKMERPRNGRS